MLPAITPAGPTDPALPGERAGQARRVGRMSGRGLGTALLLPVCAMLGTRAGWGQNTGSAGWRMAGVWVAAGPNAAFESRAGTKHHNEYLLGVRVERQLVGFGAMKLYYTVDALPLVLSTASPVHYDRVDSTWVPHMGTVYGFGLVPVGVELRWTRLLHLVAGASVGALLFTQPLPDPLSTRFNFSIAGDIGVRVPAGDRCVVELRYRFEHISNGGMTYVNPGLNAHMVQVGLAVR